jgi:7-carboxy-7-deazaguanine synthase
MPLKVNEIFHSIQGESSWAGRPCTLVRLTGCNLRCAYCDTTYAYEEGEWMEIPAIESRIEEPGCRLIEITGGEPLLQNETPVLIRRLLDRGYTVLLETNGSQDIGIIDERCVRIVDIKCPSSGEAERFDRGNLPKLTATDEIKFVIGGREDYDYARKFIGGALSSANLLLPPLFSPVSGRMDVESLASWILEDRLDVRLQIQLHKIIWGADRRGV